MAFQWFHLLVADSSYMEFRLFLGTKSQTSSPFALESSFVKEAKGIEYHQRISRACHIRGQHNQ